MAKGEVLPFGFWIDDECMRGWTYLDRLWRGMCEQLKAEGVQPTSSEWIEATHRLRARRAKYIQDNYHIAAPMEKSA